MDFSKLYLAVLRESPDVLTVEQMSRILGISVKTGYQLLKDNKIISMKVGRSYRIAKVHLLSFLKINGLPA